MNHEIKNHLSSFTNQRLGHVPKSHDSIELLAEDISKNLPETTELMSAPDFEEVPTKETIDDQKSINKLIPIFLYEPIIIVVLYVFMSQSIVHTAIGRYITYIRPDENGNVSQIGILLYGIILSYFYYLVKTILLK